MSITARTRVAGVVGQPISHSLSPVIHNAWLEAAKIDAAYHAFAPTRDGFRRFIEGLRGGVILGLNVTIPFKEEALHLADRASATARLCGASNLLLFRQDGTIEADNTDGFGLLGALALAGFKPDSGPIVMIGAGGAARGAVFALLKAGAPRIHIVNRSVDRAVALADLDERLLAHEWHELGSVLGGAAAVINATSLGMTGQSPLDLPVNALPPTAVVMDMVYRPLRTPLLLAARQRDLRIVDGLSMLIMQAVPSFEALFGQPPPDVHVRRLCEQALGEA